MKIHFKHIMAAIMLACASSSVFANTTDTAKHALAVKLATLDGSVQIFEVTNKNIVNQIKKSMPFAPKEFFDLLRQDLQKTKNVEVIAE